MSGASFLSGSFYSWGKGTHEKPRATDIIEYSSPKMILEQKSIIHVSFGVNHVMLLDRHSSLYAYGEGTLGCLGFGDGRKRFAPMIV